jgi:hypothetical protein
VKRQVSHEGFVKDGKLDVESFSAAVAAEITDWESLGVSQSVLGMGTSLRHENKTEAMAQDSDSRVENLLKLVK